MLGPQYVGKAAYDATSKDWHSYYSSSNPGEVPFKELPKKLNMTTEEAQAWALNAMARIGFGQELRVACSSVCGLRDTDFSDGREENNYAYLIKLIPMVDDIPVFHEVSRLETDPYETAYYYRDEAVTIAVNDTGLHELSIGGYFALKERLNANVGLMDAERIKELAVQALFNENAYWDEQEQEGVLTIYIDRMELGYGRTTTKDDPAGQMLIPMWNVYCTYDSPGQQPYYMEFPAVTLNAVDGSRM